jgi:hypothetical protein
MFTRTGGSQKYFSPVGNGGLALCLCAEEEAKRAQARPGVERIVLVVVVVEEGRMLLLVRRILLLLLLRRYLIGRRRRPVLLLLAGPETGLAVARSLHIF